MMKWIKSSDQKPPRDRVFIAYKTDKHGDKIVHVYSYRSAVLNQRKRVIESEMYTCECNYYDCDPIAIEDVFYWMELLEKPDE